MKGAISGLFWGAIMTPLIALAVGVIYMSITTLAFSEVYFVEFIGGSFFLALLSIIPGMVTGVVTGFLISGIRIPLLGVFVGAIIAMIPILLLNGGYLLWPGVIILSISGYIIGYQVKSQLAKFDNTFSLTTE